MKHNRRYIAIAIATLVAAIAGASVQRAAAGSEVCTPCVILVEVDGLEPKDVTPQTTPFMWALAHPNMASTATQNPTDAGAAIAAASTPAMAGRAGFMWQAGRGTMTASLAADAFSLLTGSYAEQDDVPADQFMKTDGKLYKLGDNDNGIGTSPSQTLPELIKDQSDNKFATFIGDPRLAGVAGIEEDPTWKPANSDSVPAFCTPPANRTEFAATNPSNSEFGCPTVDMNTMNHASDLANEGTNGKVTFAYIHLAELGATKRLYGDIDSSNPASPSVAAALADTDAAVGYFVNRYNQEAGEKWGKTVLFVVGNHGYESTPIAQRVPDPAAVNDPGMGLEQYVKSITNDATLVPQGTMATVYVGTDSDHSKLRAVYAGLTTAVNDTPACKQTGGCIDQVLFTDPALDDDQANHSHSVAYMHPSWRLHGLDKGVPTGSDGDLIVTLKPGWATGQAIPTDTGNPPNTYGVIPDDSGRGEITNPYNGTAGGPRNRAIATIVNGPSDTVVRQVDNYVGGRYPVAKVALDELHCPENATQLTPEMTATPPGMTATTDVNVANATPEDDANSVGHECQPETVDFLPTIAALLKISVPDRQLGGRFLQEAFKQNLFLPHDDPPLPQSPPEEPPPPPEPDVYIPPQPPPPSGFDFHGLVRNLRVRVVDAKGCPWNKARPGSKLDYLRIEGDFGKTFSAVSLTFYKEAVAKKASAKRSAQVVASAAAKGCSAPAAETSATRPVRDPRAPLKAIAHFNAFKLKRGHVVLRLKIPDLFKPTHIGVHVREARELAAPKTAASGKPGLKFEAFGPAAGDIIRITDGPRLHAKTPAPRSAPKPPGGSRK